MSESTDNRETCGTQLPSSCIPFTGYISNRVKEDLPCRPNINDVLTNIQNIIDGIKDSLGDNTALTKECFDFNPATATQQVINQEIITKLCALKTAVEALQEPIDPDTINIAVNLLCLLDEGCDPQTTYTLTEILTKLITAYCNLLTRVVNIETILNI